MVSIGTDVLVLSTQRGRPLRWSPAKTQPARLLCELGVSGVALGSLQRLHLFTEAGLLAVIGHTGAGSLAFSHTRGQTILGPLQALISGCLQELGLLLEHSSGTESATLRGQQVLLSVPRQVCPLPGLQKSH